MVATTVGPWVEAFIILGYYTVFYKDNVIFRIVQRTCIASCIAYSFIYSLNRLNTMGIQQIPVESTVIIPLILGALILFRLSERYGWISRYPTSFLMGIGFGLTGARTVMSMMKAQVEDTLFALAEPSITAKINGLVVLVGVVTVMIYFIYTLKEIRPVKWTMRLGRYMLMAALGAGAADFVTGGMVWAIDPISRVVYHWLQLG